MFIQFSYFIQFVIHNILLDPMQCYESSSCGSGGFCNFDIVDSTGTPNGFCEYCADITGSGIKCNESGLTEAGVTACQAVCEGWLLHLLKY